MFAVGHGTARTGPAVDSPSSLFEDTDTLLNSALLTANSISGFEDKSTKIDPASFPSFDHLYIYEQCHDSGPSSVQHEESSDVSDLGGSLPGTKDGTERTASHMKGWRGKSQDDIKSDSLSECQNRLPHSNRNGSIEDIAIQQTGNNAGISPLQAALLQEATPATDNASETFALTNDSRDPDYTSRTSTETLVGSKVDRTTSSEMPQQHQGSHSKPSTPIKHATKNTLDRVRPKSSIPASLAHTAFAKECIKAAFASRLDAWALHPKEYDLLKQHITLAQVNTYLNIRNAILRLWWRNSELSVTKEEAAGCAKESRLFDLAFVAYEWLVRQGYINHGCVQVPSTIGPIPRVKSKGRKPRTIVVIGAGMSGLGCARQLEGLVAQLGDRWTGNGEKPPRIIVLEGRNRIGGRVYSHPWHKQAGKTLPDGLRSTAEMGGMIVTGFEHGNPLTAIIRRQLRLRCHMMDSHANLYDCDGKLVDEDRDQMMHALYKDILERASVFMRLPTAVPTAEGEPYYINEGRDPSNETGPVLAELEGSQAPVPVPIPTRGRPKSKRKPPTRAPQGVEKLTGKSDQPDSKTSHLSPAEAATAMGFDIKGRLSTERSIEIRRVMRTADQPNLGDTMDDALVQYKDTIDLDSRDMRLFHWHQAHLEYANAANVNKLGLEGWDQDNGNEFQGKHAEIVGGYTQVLRGLYLAPMELDIRFNSPVTTVRYDPASDGAVAKIECKNGDVYEADRVVITAPLGVLKERSINFQPSLPDWKQGAIDRMGFGLLNKVVLKYKEVFWENERDIFGILNEGQHHGSMDPSDYLTTRGRFCLFFNCTQSSGRPTLVAIMAGDAAYQTEKMDDESLVQEVTERLAKTFAPAKVPKPEESVITRWLKDPFARGSYSYIGTATQFGDYDVMAKPIGPLHFAGEATCGTHPATVHGAYLSGLRAASEVVESLIGPIQISSPLIPPRHKPDPTHSSIGQKRKENGFTQEHPLQNGGHQSAIEAYEASIFGAILSELGDRPIPPKKGAANPFLLYSNANWQICKAKCNEARRKKAGSPDAKASREEIRVALGLMWRKASQEEKRTFVEQAQAAKAAGVALFEDFKKKALVWDTEAARIRKEFIEKNPMPGGEHAQFALGTAIELGNTKNRKLSGYAEQDSDVDS